MSDESVLDEELEEWMELLQAGDCGCIEVTERAAEARAAVPPPERRSEESEPPV